MVKIAPSILSADFAHLQRDISIVEEAGAEWLHIDVMDGHFVPNITIGPLVVSALRPHCKMVFDVHLMIENPDNYIDQFVEAGADVITVHVEACRHLHRTIQKIKTHDIKAGVALNPATPLNCVENILGDVDMVLIMSVNPGFAAQKFIPSVLPKISSLRKIIDENNYETEIQVDGGINAATGAEAVKAGAGILVAGSAIFNAPDIGQAIKQIRKAIQE